jgi:hypothetical protein
MDGLLLAALGGGIVIAFDALRRRFTGFNAQKPADYAGTGPQFDLRQHLNGPIRCEGVIFGPLGRVTSRFDANFQATWEGNTGVMTEHFRYDSGNTQDREWQLILGNDGQFKATASDLVGMGEGVQSGSTVELRYRLRLPEDAGGHVLSAVDWMYLTPEGVIVNRSQFRKFGIKVAELVATMTPADTARA